MAAAYRGLGSSTAPSSVSTPLGSRIQPLAVRPRAVALLQPRILVGGFTGPSTGSMPKAPTATIPGSAIQLPDPIHLAIWNRNRGLPEARIVAGIDARRFGLWPAALAAMSYFWWDSTMGASAPFRVGPVSKLAYSGGVGDGLPWGFMRRLEFGNLGRGQETAVLGVFGGGLPVPGTPENPVALFVVAGLN